MAESVPAVRDRQIADLQHRVSELEEFRNRLGEFQALLVNGIQSLTARVEALEGTTNQPQGATTVRTKHNGLQVVAR